MDNTEKIQSRIKDVSILKKIQEILIAEKSNLHHDKSIRIEISDISDTPFNLFEFNKVGIRIWEKGENGREKSEYKLVDNFFARDCFLDTLNANKRAILQSMITKMCEEIKVDYDMLWMQMHQLGNSMTENIDKYLCTEEKEIVTKVLTIKYAENEEMSDKNEILEKS